MTPGEGSDKPFQFNFNNQLAKFESSVTQNFIVQMWNMVETFSNSHTIITKPLKTSEEITLYGKEKLNQTELNPVQHKTFDFKNGLAIA